MDGWMDGWMDEWMDRYIHRYTDRKKGRLHDFKDIACLAHYFITNT